MDNPHLSAAAPVQSRAASETSSERLHALSMQKRRVLERNARYLMPHRVETWLNRDTPLVIGRREAYRLWDLDGAELQDFHLNGGTFNFGHRHPVLLDALDSALASLDVGNHHFPSSVRADAAERLAQATPGDLHYSVFTPSGSEAVDVAIKAARWVTQRRKIVTFEQGYHGASGLSGAAGAPGNAQYFLSDSENFVRVPFDDLDALERELKRGDVAALIAEPLPATAGFPVPHKHFFRDARLLCDTYGTVLIADEVQTGFGRSGKMWAIETFSVIPDILVTGKALGGGLYPVACAVMTRQVGAWLNERGWGYISTYGGSELGCAVACASLDLAAEEDTKCRTTENAAYLRAGLDELRGRYSYFTDIRQLGMIFGLGFDEPTGGERMSTALFRAGLWAMFASFDRRYLQFKPGLLVDRGYCDEALNKVETALRTVTK